MNEFSIIGNFFNQSIVKRDDVVFGIGDDAACLKVPAGQELLISTDTLVEGVHFLTEWDAYDIAWRSVMVNVSDMAAMAAKPCWISLALTIPHSDTAWLSRFAQGIHDALALYQIALIGGDTTHGPLTITLTIHGLADEGKAVRRSTANPGDSIWVSGELGAAALAVKLLKNQQIVSESDKAQAFARLIRPEPRLDLQPLLTEYASAAVDISDGLSADLNHICQTSGTGALIVKEQIPVHPLLKKYQLSNAMELAISGGDDYELCFTIPESKKRLFIEQVNIAGIRCAEIGVIEKKAGLRMADQDKVITLTPRGYSHF
ncbi:thiamine-phosphate kinase [Legionella dresdenensis]|uniref:Thiamine-monophosphate kinase n=1 Tax=Legionella dresdenensis TaxID=450200 RepID=A0ABV8CEW6_9GAMM